MRICFRKPQQTVINLSALSLSHTHRVKYRANSASCQALDLEHLIDRQHRETASVSHTHTCREKMTKRKKHTPQRAHRETASVSHTHTRREKMTKRKKHTPQRALKMNCREGFSTWYKSPCTKLHTTLPAVAVGTKNRTSMVCTARTGTRHTFGTVQQSCPSHT